MAEALLSPVIDALLEKLSNELLFVGFFAKELHHLRSTLVSIQAVVEDAEEKRLTSEAITGWFQSLKDVAYDAEDVIDELYAEALRPKMEGLPQESSCAKQVSTLFSFFSCNKGRAVVRREMRSKMKVILERLEEIVNEGRSLRLRERLDPRGSKLIEKSERSQTYSYQYESELFGRDKDRENIIKILLSEDASTGNNISVFSIVGMGGIGKTTLVRVAYNDKRVNRQFDLKAWVSGSEHFDVQVITKAIIESATRVRVESLGIEPLQSRLSQILRGKKILIVLDDVWNDNLEIWESLSLPLKAGARGSKIIVTTRIIRVAYMMSTIPPYQLSLLSEEESWALFSSKVFVMGEENSKLMDIGWKIVRKCGGLPLAIMTLASLLSSKRDEDEWRNIAENNIWDISENRSYVLPALKLSYNNLPSNLKRCFAYCALFPKGHEFDKDELVRLWMGEGYIHPKPGLKMEEEGDWLFDDLLTRAFFLISSDDEKIYTMHDLINEIAVDVSKGERFQLKQSMSGDLPHLTRHASLICDKEGSLNFELLYKAKHLRTIHVLHDNHLNCKVTVPSDLFLKLRFLRVLNLSFCGITDLPNSMGNLIFLSYLDLSHTLIQELPESTATLYSLQTCKLDHCYELIKLPLRISNLENLRHLTFPAFSEMKLTSMPADTGKLTSLQTLSGFVVGREVGCRIGELKNLKDLSGKFYISRLNNVLSGEDAEEANLKNKRNLFELNLEWDYSDDKLRDADFDEKVLAGLEPHPSLRKLSVCHYQGGKFPSWLQYSVLYYLVSIKLYNCRGCISLPPLGQLHRLRHLCIDGMDRLKQLGPDFYGDGSLSGFMSLEQLELSWMFNLEEWLEIEGAMPILHQLSIRYCPSLRQLPNFLSTLMKLEIEYCKSLTALPRLPSISKLVLSNCNEAILSSITHLTSLSSLTTDKFLPEGWVWPLPHLKKLKVRHFPEMLLPNGVRLQNLPSLQTLVFENCHELQSLQNVDLPTTLAYLKLICCDNLKFLPAGWKQSGIRLHHQDCPELSQ